MAEGLVRGAKAREGYLYSNGIYWVSNPSRHILLEH